ncbi:uncharacterized protein LOC124130894 [Haliotis rufescens]|uniref:uncharacterized protein LOC124130894 n=1 Tax=Haliotis rufescens TaxID=6454 RepID=UPI00201EA531|nr:uncharacterized protein LOC124130894 [Haliotis rufescens]
MTNKNKCAKKPRLRYLDLSFEGRDQAHRAGISNGRRPHGGYKGCSKHPPTPLSQEKSREYHRKLRAEIDQLFDEEFLEVHGSPTWSVEASKEVTHSGESPLFLHKFMSPSKEEHQYIRLSKSAVLNPNKCQPPLSRDGVTYYRPNRTHQYLSATELKDQSQNEVNLKYGRPTRTTLLRARQRTNSAPVNSYEIRRETMKREGEIKTGSAYTNTKEFFQELHATNGESFHSFITGARYNRAHCLDSKSLTMYGVYMPRNNPTACFVTHKLKDVFDTPCAPPDSPRSDVDEVSSPMTPRRPKTAPGYGRRPTPATSQPKQAWGDSHGNEADKHGDERVYEELIFWPSGLNVKGRGMGVTLNRANSMPKLNSRLPSVQGISMERIRKSRDPVEETSLINQPPPTPNAMSAKDGADKSNHMTEEKVKDDEEPRKEPVIKPRKPKPILVDRSVNVPSVSGDSNHWNDEPLIINAHAVPQTRSHPGSVKSVTIQRETEEIKEKILENPKEEPTEEHDIPRDEPMAGEEHLAFKDLDIELPSVTDGASMEPLQMSEQDMTPDVDEVVEGPITPSKEEVAQESSPPLTGPINDASVAFFLTENGQNKKGPDGDCDVINTSVETQDTRPVLGNATSMAIPALTVEEASVSDENDTADDGIRDNSAAEEFASKEVSKGDNSVPQTEDDVKLPEA